VEPLSEDAQQIVAMLERFREEMKAAFARMHLRLDSIIAQLDRINAKGRTMSPGVWTWQPSGGSFAFTAAADGPADFSDASPLPPL
jgi:hypothetical protein